MENQIERPISVSIAQILLALLTSYVFLLTFLFVLIPIGGAYLYRAVPMLVIFLLPCALSVTAFWGMAQCRPYGRWLGVGILSVVLIFLTLVRLFEPFGPVVADLAQRNTSAQVFLSVLTLAVILHISFSKKAADFFSQGRPPLS